MRSIGTLPTEQEALTLSGALLLRGMENEIENEDDGRFSVWVHDDNQLVAAREMFARYQQDPKAPEFSRPPSDVARVRAEAEKAERKAGSNIITAERLAYEQSFKAFAWVPVVLILACVAVAVQSETVLSNQPGNIDWLRWLYISIQPSNLIHDYQSPGSLQEIGEGEIWRLFTPMLIHFGALHLLFNMMWLRDLGTFIQNRYSALYLATLILTVAAGSNLAQYCWEGARFGGMSGVNYGLFGFLWIRGKFDRFAGWQLNPVIVQTMLMWFFLCLTGLLGPVANMAHFAGLMVGGVWGYASAQWAAHRR